MTRHAPIVCVCTSFTALTLLREQPWDLTFNPQASQHAALIHTRDTGKALQGEDNLALNNVQKLISRYVS